MGSDQALPEFSQYHDLKDDEKILYHPISILSPPSARHRGARNMGVLLLFSMLCALGLYVVVVTADSARSTTLGLNAPSLLFKLPKSWAQYSPYFPVEEYGDPPQHCRVTQVNIIQRHGARYPTSGSAKMIVAALNKLLSVEEFTDDRLNFLKDYNYRLGENDLLPFGARESQLAGQVHFTRYKHLVSHGQLPYYQQSKILSASNIVAIAGFSIASHHVYNPSLSLIISEKLNNTLHAEMCPNAGTAIAQTSEWLSKYGPAIAERLNRHAPGANLTSTDVFGLLSLCPFESVSLNRLSSFCKLFSESEFQQFEYSGDLDKYYNTGYGQPLGPVQGVGYVNELLARLTGTPVRDNTQTNRTLDASPVTFPLNRTIYADFSHDNQMIAIYAAIGLFKQHTAPDPSFPNPKRNWLASHLVPFSARMVTEKLACGRRGEEFVRIFVNDAMQPLEFCGAGKDGLCTLRAFVESQAYARNDGNGDFEKCYE
ncbi:hypothetical protein D9615_010152 [Tricholomella constricta]|uniref:Phytase A n=1 Tax=Tricholomella constricta TaxID=117010 RepID=A0A8H5GRC9_9AGAR|nr:hypothetical protein D9615_010152 [Tricholomella constricta]